MEPIPESHQDLVSDETCAYAVLATTMLDGTPQATPIWFSMDEGYVLVNTAEGRVKARNMRERRAVALTILDPDNPYRYLQVRGRVVEIIQQGAREHIDLLARKYTGQARYPNFAGETRLIFRILPDSVTAGG